MGTKPPKEVIEFLRRAGRLIRIERAILFGSRAKGRSLDTSDYDLVLVSPDFAGRPFYERPAPLLLLWDHPQDLEMLCYTPEEFEQKRRGVNIVATATSEGIEIKA